MGKFLSQAISVKRTMRRSYAYVLQRRAGRASTPNTVEDIASTTVRSEIGDAQIKEKLASPLYT